MDALKQTTLRTQLTDRRERLEGTIARYKENPELERLLLEVDSALDRMDKGSYGLCELCHEPIENDWLRADPLVRICLAHLTPEQQQQLAKEVRFIEAVKLGEAALERGEYLTHEQVGERPDRLFRS